MSNPWKEVYSQIRKEDSRDSLYENSIWEEIKPANAPEKKEKGDAKGGDASAKKVRQAVYDIRYRARREEIPLPKAFTQYMANTSMSPKERTMVRAKLMGEGLETQDVQEVAPPGAKFERMVKHVKKGYAKDGLTKKEKSIAYATAWKQYNKEEVENIEEEEKEKVRVTDKESGRTYVRKADKHKQSELRANPHIQSVERTDYGEPYEGKYKSGKNTVGDKDGDGTKEPDSHEYAGVKDRAIKKAMASKTKKESFSNWRSEIEDDFFLDEKRYPQSPHCEVMPELKDDNVISKSKGTEKANKRLKPEKSVTKEDLELVAEELGGELIEQSISLSGSGGGATGVLAGVAVDTLGKVFQNLNTLRDINRFKAGKVDDPWTQQWLDAPPTHRPGQKPTAPPTHKPKPKPTEPSKPAEPSKPTEPSKPAEPSKGTPGSIVRGAARSIRSGVGAGTGTGTTTTGQRTQTKPQTEPTKTLTGTKTDTKKRDDKKGPKKPDLSLAQPEAGIAAARGSSWKG